MEEERWKIFVRIVLHVVALFLAILPFILLSVRQAQPFQRGFFCTDESIRYPYRPDSVSAQALFMGTLLISTGIILTVELCRCIYSRCTSSETSWHRLSYNCSLPSVIYVLYRVLGSLYFGFALTLGLTDIGKFSAGRLRPHFLYVCRPDPTSYNCTSPGSSQSVYVENFRCFGTNQLALWNARLSFPSGHASLSAYFAVFMLIYLQVRLTWKPLKMLRHVLQGACYAAAIYICISRISDNAHNWSDVLPGAFLGNLIGILVILHVCRILKLASDLAKGKRLQQQEMTSTETSGADVRRPVAKVPTMTTPMDQPKTPPVLLSIYNTNPNLMNNGAGENNYAFHDNLRGFATAAHSSSSHQPQQPFRMPSSPVRYT